MAEVEQLEHGAARQGGDVGDELAVVQVQTAELGQVLQGRDALRE